MIAFRVLEHEHTTLEVEKLASSSFHELGAPTTTTNFLVNNSDFPLATITHFRVEFLFLFFFFSCMQTGLVNSQCMEICP